MHFFFLQLKSLSVHVSSGGGAEGGGAGGSGGEGGEDGEGGPQQASLQVAEIFFFFFWHKFVHFFLVSSLHASFTFLLSFPLHVVLSLSASQFFGDGVAAVTLRSFATNDSRRRGSNDSEDGDA